MFFYVILWFAIKESQPIVEDSSLLIQQENQNAEMQILHAQHNGNKKSIITQEQMHQQQIVKLKQWLEAVR